jgi:hypothetical protein
VPEGFTKAESLQEACPPPYVGELAAAENRLRPLARIAGRLAVPALVLFLLDAAVFRYAYPYWVEPDSTTGSVEMRLWNERKRERSGRPEILALGDSRMPLFPRIANELAEETGYFYAGISNPGTSPRCWYYMLRDVDPDANLYRAILIPEYRYEDRDSYDRYDDRIRDLNYIVGELRLSDVWEFASSFDSLEFKLKALRGALWKGFVYQTDFQQFLADPLARVEKVEWHRRDQWEWVYNYEGVKDDLAGLRADWENERLLYPESIPQSMRDYLEKELLRPLPPDTERFRAYRKKWYGKILDHYEGSGTKIVFLRMARGPVARPAGNPNEETSVVRELASHPNVIVMDEHAFDSMEQPELFMDPLHMNGKGSRIFSLALAKRIVELLGSGRAGS